MSPAPTPTPADRRTGPAVASGDLDALGALVLRCLDAWEERGSAALEDLCREHADRAPALRARVRALQEAGLLASTASLPAFPEKLGEFRLLSRLGGGGMGVVYLARQDSLGRDVALKLVRPDQLYFPGARERFQREAAAVARLQHPAIVPIYTFGEEQGIPYFAMERVQGCTLGEVLEELAGRPPSSLTGRDLAAAVIARAEKNGCAAASPGASRLAEQGWIEAALHLVRDVALALAHAHERGVAHRDVKPSNLMVTLDGRVLLTDFGLAASEGATKLTRTGSQLGSLPYMAPEQVRGESADARCDVYALGVTLYELLALELPYQAESSEHARARILAGRPAPLRARNPAVAWDVETVCLTAMELERERRYAGAEAFARDLSNLLALRPIEARRPGTWLRTKRWTQRRPALAVGLALGSLLLVGAPTALAIQQSAANREITSANSLLAEANLELGRTNDQLATANEKLSQALDDATRERERAETSFRDALDAVDRMLARVGETTLADVPQMEGVRRDLLEDALAFYDRLLAQRADDPALRQERARIGRVRSDVLAMLGRRGEAESGLREHTAVLRELALAPGADDDARFQFGFAANQLAELLREGGRIEEAEPLFRDALAALDEIVARSPENPTYLHQQAVALNQWGACLGLGGRREESLDAHRRAVEAAREAVRLGPDEPAYPSVLTYGLQRLGTGLRALRKAAEGEAPLREAYEIGEAMVARDARSHEGRRSLAVVCLDYGLLLTDLSRWEDAERVLRRGIEVYEDLVRDFPSVPIYQDNLAGCCLNLGAMFGRMGKLDQAEVEFERARASIAPRAAAEPDVPYLQSRLGMVLGNLAEVRLSRGELERFDELIAPAVAALERARALNPQMHTYAMQLGDAYLNTANARVQQRRHADAAAAIARVFELVPDHPYAGPYAAGTLAACVGLLAEDASLTESERSALSEDYAGRAVAALRGALERGYRPPKPIDQDPELAPLLAFESFRELAAGAASSETAR